MGLPTTPKRNHDALVAGLQEEDDDEHAENFGNNSAVAVTEQKKDDTDESIKRLFPGFYFPDISPAFEKNSIVKLNPLQSAAFPLITKDKDVVVRAVAGSGKRLAYLIPMFEYLLACCPPLDIDLSLIAIVIVPTSDLCQYVSMLLESLFRPLDNIQKPIVADLSHGMPSFELFSPSEPPNVVISTPAYVLPYLRPRYRVTYSHQYFARFLIFDEIHSLLSHGFEDDLKSIVASVSIGCQRHFFSSDPSFDIRKLKNLIRKNPYIITSPGEGVLNIEILPYNVEQSYILCDACDKLILIHALLRMWLKDKKVLLFTNSDAAGSKLKVIFEKFRLKSAVLDARLPDVSRVSIIKSFDDGALDSLIVTELDPEVGIAKGLDFKNVDTVINFDMPPSISGYARRIDRTGKGVGEAISLVTTHEDQGIIDHIEFSHPGTIVKHGIGEVIVRNTRCTLESHEKECRDWEKSEFVEMLLQGMM